MIFENKSEEIGLRVAEELLKVGAVKLNHLEPFQWASGWQSPIYCDNRLTLSYPKTRLFIKNALVEGIRKHFPEVEVIAGVATAGIPQASLIADAMTLPLIYVRDKPKGHGMRNAIEGFDPVDKKVVVIEDLISTGGSSLKAVAALREAQANVLGMAAIFTYGFDIASENFKNASVPFFTLSNYDLMIKNALAQNYLTKDDTPILKAWQHSPHTWKQ